MTGESPNNDPWKYRRRFMVAYTAFVMTIVFKSVFYPLGIEMFGVQVFSGDAEVAKVTISAGLTSLGAVVGAYVFGAAWERHKMGGS